MTYEAHLWSGPADGKVLRLPGNVPGPLIEVLDDWLPVAPEDPQTAVDRLYGPRVHLYRLQSYEQPYRYLYVRSQDV